MVNKYLDKVYEVSDGDGTRKFYDDWSGSYDAEVAGNGYVTPDRCAEALAEFVDDKDAPVLDFGCGTGLAGVALRRAGFTVIDGVDLSAEMLAQAEAKGIYRKLTHCSARDGVPSGYRVISAVGVIGAGAAPISVFDALMHALPKGGRMVFSFNDHTLADPGNVMRLNEWLDCGAARLLFSEHGPHLPARQMGATVYVIEKA